jgi:hypothetical protein
MFRLFNGKALRVFLSALGLLGLVFSALPLTAVLADNENSIALTVINPPAGASWVTVQWLDGATGKWNNVDGWTAVFDESNFGWIKYGVDHANDGQGPFRWVLFDKQDGVVLGMSDPFFLAVGNDLTVWSSITLPSAPTGAPLQKLDTDGDID